MKTPVSILSFGVRTFPNGGAGITVFRCHRSSPCFRRQRACSRPNRASKLAAYGNRAKSESHSTARGSVIMIVLITILFATMALGLFIERASTDLLVESREATASRMRLEATSALETTIGVLTDFHQVNGALRSPAEGWADPLAFAGYEPSEGRTVEIAFEDESGKFSLPNASASTLVNLFTAWGLSQSDAGKLSDALLGWMKKDHVAGSASAPRAEDYERGELPFAPPARPLRSFDELAAIDYAKDVFYDENRQPNELWQRFVNAFSLYSYQAPNINGANPDYFSGLGGTDTSRQKIVDDYLHGTGAYQSRGSGYFKNAQEASALLGGAMPADNLGTEIRALRIIVTVREGRNSYRLNALVAPPGGAEIPATQPAAGKGQDNAGHKDDPNVENSQMNGGQTGGAQVSKKLNYPFAVLEFRENDAMSSPSTNPASER